MKFIKAPIIDSSGKVTGFLLIDNKDAFSETPEAVITVGFKPGVTDNRASAALDGFTTIFPDLDKDVKISTSISYVFFGLGDVDLNWLSDQLHNSLIDVKVCLRCYLKMLFNIDNKSFL